MKKSDLKKLLKNILSIEKIIQSKTKINGESILYEKAYLHDLKHKVQDEFKSKN